MNATKPTPLGDLPADWQVMLISQMIQDGFILEHLDGNHGELYPRSHEFKPSGVPYIGATDFASGNVSFKACKYLSKDRANKFKKGVAKDGDVLFAHNATVGPVALLSTSEEIVILSTTATYFRCNPEKLSNRYLHYALQAQYFVNQYTAVMAQSTRFQVPITTQRKLNLVLPPLPEQRAIADALGDIDAWIGAQEALIVKKRDLKTATMAQLLTGQIRLAGFDGDWQTKTLGEMSEMNSGGTPPSSDSSCYGGEIPWVSIADMTSNKCDIYKTERNLSEKGLANSSAKLFPAGTILYAMYASIGECSIAAVELCSSQAILGIRPKSALDGLFLYYLLTSLKDEVKTMGQQGTQSNLNMGMVKGFEIKLPPLAEQIAIAGILSGLDEELAALDAQLDKTRQLKAATMTALLAGEKRLV